MYFPGLLFNSKCIKGYQIINIVKCKNTIANRIVGIVLVLGNIPLDKDVAAGPIADVDVTKIGWLEVKLSPFFRCSVDVGLCVAVGANALVISVRCP